MKNKIMVVGAIVSSVYLIMSPYKMYFFIFAVLFAAYTLYRYIIFKAEQDSWR